METLWLAFGMVGAAYFIGEGLKNFKNPNGKSLLANIDDDDHPMLIRESDVHHVLGITKDDAKQLVQEYPDIPHVKINGNVYYHKKRLQQWLMSS